MDSARQAMAFAHASRHDPDATRARKCKWSGAGARKRNRLEDWNVALRPGLSDMPETVQTLPCLAARIVCARPRRVPLAHSLSLGRSSAVVAGADNHSVLLAHRWKCGRPIAYQWAGMTSVISDKGFLQSLIEYQIR